MTMFTVTYRYSNDIATRDALRGEHRDYLRDLADKAYSWSRARSAPTTRPARCCYSAPTAGTTSTSWSHTTRSPHAAWSPPPRPASGSP
jgi:hypothetical protein